MPEFESKILQSIKFWNKNHFWKFKIRWKNRFQKPSFVGKFTPKKRRKWHHCVFWKAKIWGKEKTFESSFLRSLKFWINCFETRQILIQVFWTGLFLSQLFKSRQFWNWKINKVSDHQAMWEVFFQKNSMGSFKPVKQRNKRFRTFLKIINLRRKIWNKKQILNLNF